MGYHVSVGARTFVDFDAVFLDCAPATVGAEVRIVPDVRTPTPLHELGTERRRAGWERAEPVSVGDDVRPGDGVIVCPGVTIGADTVVGAGSGVVRGLPSGVLAVGDPARVVRRLGT
ncbi:hypothetical protein [Streptomyces sp. DH12]|uniref:hypothetical protein n=1 Tax=Streptomyces sp. DH12 TaxID=2857010 RepID=UPI0027D31B62|nr:hypothetical protein [Streptomyces sp. DH12]